MPNSEGLTIIKEEERQMNTSEWVAETHESICRQREANPIHMHRFFPLFQDCKENIQRVNRMDWQYAQKIIKYEQAISTYCLRHQESQAKVQYLTEKLNQKEQQSEVLKQIIKEKDREICDLNSRIEASVLRKKIVKLKQKGSRDGENGHKTQRQRPCSKDKDKLLQMTAQLEQVRQKNIYLEKKVKSLEAERQFEDEKIRNATLSLQLDLKIRNQKIELLSEQINIYKQKFQELVTTPRQTNLKPPSGSCSLREINFLSGKEPIDDVRSDSGDEQGVRKESEVKKEGVFKKRHMRTGSSNLDEQRTKKDIKMNVKIFRNKPIRCI